MKKLKRLMFIFILIISLFSITSVYAKDVTSGFKINEVKFCDDLECNTEYNEDNIKPARRTFYVILKWEYSGDTIEKGDTVTIPFATEITTENSSAYTGSFEWADISDANGKIIGQWRIVGAGKNKRIEINFDANGIGKNKLNGTLITPKNMWDHTLTYFDRIIPFTVGDKVYKIKVSKSIFRETTDIVNGIVSTTNTAFNVRSAYGAPLKILYRFNEYNEIPDDKRCQNLIAEKVIPDGYKFDYGIYSSMGIPTDLENHYAANFDERINLNNYFEKISKNDGESYDDFKNKLSALQYGEYKNSDGSTTIVINFGDLPSSNLPTYNQLHGDSLADYVRNINPYTFSGDIPTLYDTILGNNNMVNGKISAFDISTTITTTKVYTDTPVSSDIKWTCLNGSGDLIEKTLTAKGKLVVPSAMALASGEAALVLRDKDSKLAIKGAEFTLQKKNGSNWADVKTKLVTDEGGLIKVSDLDDGEYRFIQTKYNDHYINNSFKNYSDVNLTNTLSTFQIDGTINYATNEREKVTITFKKGEHGNFNDISKNYPYGDSVVIPDVESPDSNGWTFVGWDKNVDLVATENQTYTAKWEKKVKLIEHYYVEGTTTKVKNDKSTTVNVGSNYSVTRDDSGIASKYVYVSTTGTTSGIVPDGNVEIKYYYKLKPATVTTKHLEETTNNKLADDVIQNKKYDDAYTTTKANSIGANYDMVRTTGDSVSGTITKDSYVVTYYYKKKNSKITNNISKTSTNTDITNKEDIVNYTITNNINITDYIGNGTVTITDTLPYEIDVDKSNISGALYNKDNKTLTWTETWNGIDSFNNKGNKTITKNISIVYSNINSKDRIVTNKVSSKVLLDNNTSTNSNQIDNNIKISGKVIIKYLDEDDNELTNTIEEENLVGENISSEVLDFEGYDLIDKPESEIHEIKDEITEIIYRYKKKVFNIEVEGEIGGKVTGGGSVKYGEDSNDIVINADEGYCIDKIIVDDKEINVVNCKNQTLDKFTNVKENHKVKVTFKKNNINSNPVTSSLLKVATLIILIGISSILIINRKGIKI